jgi:serine/threonine protein kinase
VHLFENTIIIEVTGDLILMDKIDDILNTLMMPDAKRQKTEQQQPLSNKDAAIEKLSSEALKNTTESATEKSKKESQGNPEVKKAEESKSQDYEELGSKWRHGDREEGYSILIDVSKAITSHLKSTNTDENKQSEVINILSKFLFMLPGYLTAMSDNTNLFESLMNLFSESVESFLKQLYDPSDAQNFPAFAKQYLTQKDKTSTEDKSLIRQSLDHGILAGLLGDFKTSICSQKVFAKLGIDVTIQGPDFEYTKTQKVKELTDRQLAKVKESKEKIDSDRMKFIAEVVDQAISTFLSSVQEAPAFVVKIKNKEILTVWNKTQDVELYELNKEIKGRGGAALIYQVTDLFTQTIHALKNATVSNWPGVKQEAELLTLIHKHGDVPGIQSKPSAVTVIKGSTIGAIHGSIGKWYGKSDLMKYQTENAMTPDQKAEAIKQILTGAAYLEKLGIAHTDPKLENVLVGEDARGNLEYRISDFGNIETLEQAQQEFKLKREELIRQEALGSKQGAEREYENSGLLYPCTTIFVLPSDLEELRKSILNDDFNRYQEIRHKCAAFALGVSFYEFFTSVLPYGRVNKRVGFKRWESPEVNESGVHLDSIRLYLQQTNTPASLVDTIVKLLAPLESRISATQALQEISREDTPKKDESKKMDES